MLNLCLSLSGKYGVRRFTPTRYRMIVRYKTAYYTFYLPCAIGMIYAGVKDPASYRLARDICCRIGEFFQIQDDFLDCFGDPKVIGKVRSPCDVIYVSYIRESGTCCRWEHGRMRTLWLGAACCSGHTITLCVACCACLDR